MKYLLSSFFLWSLAFASPVHAQANTPAGDGATAAAAAYRYINETFR